MKNTDRKDMDPRKNYNCRWERLNMSIRAGIIPKDTSDLHQFNSLANLKPVRIRTQGTHGLDDPFCEPVVDILGPVGRGNLLSQDSEDILGGNTGLKPGKKRMGG